MAVQIRNTSLSLKHKPVPPKASTLTNAQTPKDEGCRPHDESHRPRDGARRPKDVGHRPHNDGHRRQ